MRVSPGFRRVLVSLVAAVAVWQPPSLLYGRVPSPPWSSAPGFPADTISATWVKLYDSKAIRPQDGVQCITTDRHGSVYVATTPGHALLTIKYNAAGDGSVILLGESGKGIVAACFDGNGMSRWSARYVESEFSVVRPVSLAVDSAGGIYVLGVSQNYNEAYGFATSVFTLLQYQPGSVVPVTEAPAVPLRFELFPNFPNPFNPSTTIRYSLPARLAVQLSVFNALGQRVGVLQEGEQEAGNHEVTFDATGLSSGVYLYRLTAGSFVQKRKMVLVH